MTQEPVVVRALSNEHIPGIIEIDRRLAGPKRSESWQVGVQRYLEGYYPPVCHVALSGDRVVGFVLGDIRGWEYGMLASAFIDVMGVDPDYQRQGVGGRLLEAFVRQARRHGLKSVHGVIRDDDERLKAFLGSVGFKRGNLVEYELAL